MSAHRGSANGRERSIGEAAGEVRTPQGTMLVVLVYIAITVVLWGYVYYDMLRFQGISGGH
ncbi:MAG TPA: hypothetical protein VF282_08825 [Bacillota bacterium]